MALVASETSVNNITQQIGNRKENIRVAVRVRPLLPNEMHREEVVYYPTFEETGVQVRIL